MQLTDEPDKRCYPLDKHLLCHTCHLNRLKLSKQSKKTSTNNPPRPPPNAPVPSSPHHFQVKSGPPGAASMHLPATPGSSSSTSHYVSSRSGSVSGVGGADSDMATSSSGSNIYVRRQPPPPPPYAPASPLVNGVGIASASGSESSYNDSGIAGHSAPNNAHYADTSMTSSSNTNLTQNGYASPHQYRQFAARSSSSASPAPSSPSLAHAPAALFNNVGEMQGGKGFASSANVYMPSLVEQNHNLEQQLRYGPPPPRPPRHNDRVPNANGSFSGMSTGSQHGTSDYNITDM